MTGRKTKTATRHIFRQPQPAPLFPRKVPVCTAHGGARRSLFLAACASLPRSCHAPSMVSLTAFRLAALLAMATPPRPEPERPAHARARQPHVTTPRSARAPGGGLSLNSCCGDAGDWSVRERDSAAIGPAAHTALRDWSESAEGVGLVKGPPGAAGAGAARRRPDNGGRWLCLQSRHSRLTRHSRHRLLGGGALGEWRAARRGGTVPGRSVRRG